MRKAPCVTLSGNQERDELKQAVLAVWAEYHATGLHLTLEEADTWLVRLVQGQDVAPPECHR